MVVYKPNHSSTSYMGTGKYGWRNCLKIEQKWGTQNVIRQSLASRVMNELKAGGTKLEGLNITIKHQTQTQKRIKPFTGKKKVSMRTKTEHYMQINMFNQTNNKQCSEINKEWSRTFRNGSHSSSRWSYLMIRNPTFLCLRFLCKGPLSLSSKHLHVLLNTLLSSLNSLLSPLLSKKTKMFACTPPLQFVFLPL